MSNTSPTEPTRPTPIYVDADDEDPEFEPRPRRRAHTLTYVIAGLALAAVGFYAGVLTQKHEDHGSTSSAASALSAFTGRRAGATGTGTGTGAGAGATGGGATATGGAGASRFGGGTAGTVKFIDGSNIYITDANGNVVKVLTNGASTITKTDPATTKDVAPGQTVIVRGSQNSDGSYTASSVTLAPAGSTGGFGGFFGSGGGRGGGGGGTGAGG